MIMIHVVAVSSDDSAASLQHFLCGDEVEKIADEVRGRISVRLGRSGAMKKHRFTC